MPKQNDFSSDEFDAIDGTIPEEDELEGSLSDVSGTVPEDDEIEGSFGGVEGTIPEDEEEPAGAAISEEWKDGDVIDELYEIKGSAAGAMGRVYFVNHTSWKTMLAMKTPLPQIYATDKGRSDYIREAEAWIEIGMHPNVVTAFYVKTINDIPRIFLEYVDGGDLKQWISEGKVHGLETILDIAIQIAEGLAHTHKKGLVHRDLKPANVMMTTDGTARITDLGLAAAAGTGGGGTAPYMAPEQWRGEHVGSAADIYAFGCLLYQLLSGRYPFMPNGSTHTQRLESLRQAHCNSEPEALPESVPEALRELIFQCLEKLPEARPEQISVVADSLRKIYQTEIGTAYPREKVDELKLQAAGLNNRALSYLDLGQPGKADECWQEALRADPHHLESTYNRGLQLWRSGEIDDLTLVKQLEEVRTTHTDSWRDEYLLGLVHIERGDAEAAIAVLEAANEQDCDRELVAEAIGWATVGVDKWRKMVLELKGHAEEVNSIALNNEGTLGLTGSDDKTIKVWDLSNGACLHTMKGHLKAVTAVRFCMRDRLVISASKDKTLMLWDVASGDCLHSFEGHCHWVGAVDVSADGRFCLSGSADKTIRLWDLSARKLIHVFDGHEGEVCSVAFSPDGRFFLSGNTTVRKKPCLVKHWDIHSKECIGTFHDEGPMEKVKSLIYDASGESFHALYWGGIKRWSLSGKVLREWRPENISGDVRNFSTDFASNLLLLSSRQGVRVRDLESWYDFGNLPGSYAQAIALFPDGSQFLSNRGVKVELWNISCFSSQRRAPRVLSEIQRQESAVKEDSYLRATLLEIERLFSQKAYFGALSLVNEAREMPGLRRHRGLLFWNHRLGAFCRRKIFDGAWKDNFVSLSAPVAFCPDSKSCLMYSKQEGMRRVRLSDGAYEQSFDCDGYEVSIIIFSPDGKHVITAEKKGSGGQIKQWDSLTAQCLNTFVRYSSRVTAMAVSPCGLFLLVGDQEGMIRLWKISSGEMIREYKDGVPKKKISYLEFSPDGRLFVSYASKGRFYILWSVSSGVRVREMQDWRQVRSRDEEWYAEVEGKNLCLRDSNTHNCFRKLEGHLGNINSVKVSDDGCYLITAGLNEVFLWEIDWRFKEPGVADLDHRAKMCIYSYVAAHRDMNSSDLVTATTSAGFKDQICMLLQKCGYPGVSQEQVERELRQESIKSEDFFGGWHFVSKELQERDRWYEQKINKVYEAYQQGEFRSALNILEQVRPVSDRWFSDQTQEWHDALGQHGIRNSLRGMTVQGQLRFERDVMGRREFIGVSDEVLSGWSDSLLCNVRKTHKILGEFTSDVVFTDGSSCFLHYKGANLNLWDWKHKKCLATFSGHTDRVQAVLFRPDYRSFFSGGGDGAVKLWDCFSGECLQTFKSHTAGVTALALSSDSNILLSGDSNGGLNIWDVKSGALIRSINQNSARISALSVSPDGRYFAAGFDSDESNLILWDMSTGSLIFTQSLWYKKDMKKGFHVEFSRDGKHLFVRGEDYRNVQAVRYQLDWEYDIPKESDWDNGAKPFLRHFLNSHRSISAEHPLMRVGAPEWVEDDFQQLIKDLQYCGYGWLRPDGVRQQLNNMMLEPFEEDSRVLSERQKQAIRIVESRAQALSLYEEAKLKLELHYGSSRKEALKLFLRAAELYQGLGLKIQLADCLYQCGRWWQPISDSQGASFALGKLPKNNAEGSWEDAIFNYEASAELYKESGQDLGLARSMYQLAWCLQPTNNPAGDWDRAIKDFAEAAKLYGKHKEDDREAQALWQQAWSLCPDRNPNGNWFKAASLYCAVAECYRKSGERALRGSARKVSSLSCEALAYHQAAWCSQPNRNVQGDWWQTISLYEKAFYLYRKAGKLENALTSRTNQAWCLEPSNNPAGDWERAGGLYEEIVDAAKGVDNEILKRAEAAMARCFKSGASNVSAPQRGRVLPEESKNEGGSDTSSGASITDILSHKIFTYWQSLQQDGRSDPDFEPTPLKSAEFTTLDLAELLVKVAEENKVPIEHVCKFINTGAGGPKDVGLTNLIQRIAKLNGQFDEEQRKVMLTSGVIGDSSEITPVSFETVGDVVKYCQAVAAVCAPRQKAGDAAARMRKPRVKKVHSKKNLSDKLFVGFVFAICIVLVSVVVGSLIWAAIIDVGTLLDSMTKATVYGGLFGFFTLFPRGNRLILFKEPKERLLILLATFIAVFLIAATGMSISQIVDCLNQ